MRPIEVHSIDVGPHSGVLGMVLCAQVGQTAHVVVFLYSLPLLS